MDAKSIKEEIDKMLKCGHRMEAINMLDEYLNNHTDETLLFQLGELLYAEGRTTDALNKFNAVVRLNPENKKAVNYVSMIRNILDYYNKELLNP